MSVAYDDNDDILGRTTAEARSHAAIEKAKWHLLDLDARLVVRRPLAGLPAVDADVAIRVHHAGHVGQL